MVKKIGGQPPKSGITSTSVQSTKTVGSSKVGQVGATQRQDGLQKIGGDIRKIDRNNSKEILQLIEEEAEKLFSESGLPESKKETIKGAVRMAIEASIAAEEEE